MKRQSIFSVVSLINIKEKRKTLFVKVQSKTRTYFNLCLTIIESKTMGFINSSGEVLKIDLTLEEKILSNKKLLDKPIQLGKLKSLWNESEYVEKEKTTRGKYRKEVSQFVKSAEMGKKISSGVLSISELEKIADKITVFGDLKKLVIFGIKDSGENINNTYLIIKAIKQ